MEDILVTIGNFGFPIAITIFLLVRIESKLEDLTKSIEKLSNTIAGME